MKRKSFQGYQQNVLEDENITAPSVPEWNKYLSKRIRSFLLTLRSEISYISPGTKNSVTENLLQLGDNKFLCNISLTYCFSFGRGSVLLRCSRAQRRWFSEGWSKPRRQRQRGGRTLITVWSWVIRRTQQSTAHTFRGGGWRGCVKCWLGPSFLGPAPHSTLS